MIQEAIAQVIKGKELDPELMMNVMDEIMEGDATDSQKAAFLTAMTMKGETIGEITAAARVMRRHSERFLNDMDVLEIVGTGGDHANTFNISTTSAFVISALGIPVAKHGNRAASSKCGAADVLEALGADIELAPARSAQILEDIGFCFLFSQRYHTSMRYVGNVRKEIGIRTLFNVLGPLANPAGASMELLGVYAEDLVEPLTQVMVNLGAKRVMTVYGQDKLDEISLSAPTTVCEALDGNVKTYEIEPEDFGLNKCRKSDLVGGDAAENAQILREILGGQSGPKSDAVLLQVGASVHLARPECSIADGIGMAREALASGKALAQLDRFIEATRMGKEES